MKPEQQGYESRLWGVSVRLTINAGTGKVDMTPDEVNELVDNEVKAAIAEVLKDFESWEIKPHKKIYQSHAVGEYFEPGFKAIRDKYNIKE